VSPSAGATNPGGSVTTTVSTAVTDGNPQTVTLSASGLPAGATASFSPPLVQSGGSSTLTLATTAQTPAGSYAVTVVGTGGSAAHATTFTLTVNGTSGCQGMENTETGTLTSSSSQYHSYQTTVTGVHEACLDGPSGTDFDLYLQKLNGSTWTTVAQATSPGPDEKLTYTGTAGTYRYRVHAYSGGGAYTLGYNAP
jgi:hypothetical protein